MVYVAKVPGYDDYLVTKCGKVISLRFGKVKQLKPAPNHKGYLSVALWKEKKQRSTAIHRLVLRAFVGEPSPGCVAMHLNDDRQDNRLENLKWGTPKENTRQMIDRGREHFHFRDGI